MEGLRILTLNQEDYCTLHWLAVLLDNRRFDIAAPLALTKVLCCQLEDLMEFRR